MIWDPGTRICDFAIFNLWLLRLLCSLHPAGRRRTRKGNGTQRAVHHSDHIPWIRAPMLGHTYLQKEAGKCNPRVGPEGRGTGLVNSQVVSDPTHLFYFLIPFRY